MTYGVLKPQFESLIPKSKKWAVHQFKGNAGIVLDTHPGRDDLPSVMVIGTSRWMTTSYSWAEPS